MKKEMKFELIIATIFDSDLSVQDLESAYIFGGFDFTFVGPGDFGKNRYKVYTEHTVEYFANHGGTQILTDGSTWVLR